MFKLQLTFNDIYLFIYLSLFIVVQVQLSAFFPHHSPATQPFPPPSPDPTTTWFCPCILYSCS